MTSKIDKADAQEWLESLQQVGEGWWRQVNLAVRAGAHKALGMERREFARSIGQRMIDPSDAIKQLFRDGASKHAIADILGLTGRTVDNVLIEAGLIEGEPWVVVPGSGGKKFAHPSALNAGGTSVGESDESGETSIADIAQLQRAIEELQAQIVGERTKRADETKELKDKISEYRQTLLNAEREAEIKAKEGLTDKERALALKEAQAWAEEQGRKILASMAPQVVSSVIGGLEDAIEALAELRAREAVTAERIAQIEQAHARFTEELGLTKMLVAGV